MLSDTTITKQFVPQQVMKRDTRFSAGVRVIAGERWGFSIKQPSVRFYLKLILTPVCLAKKKYFKNRSQPNVSYDCIKITTCR